MARCCLTRWHGEAAAGLARPGGPAEALEGADHHGEEIDLAGLAHQS
jgi:hypothetical protein